jgi:hypothetical protein
MTSFGNSSVNGIVGNTSQVYSEASRWNHWALPIYIASHHFPSTLEELSHYLKHVIGTMFPFSNEQLIQIQKQVSWNENKLDDNNSKSPQCFKEAESWIRWGLQSMLQHHFEMFDNCPRIADNSQDELYRILGFPFNWDQANVLCTALHEMDREQFYNNKEYRDIQRSMDSIFHACRRLPTFQIIQHRLGDDIAHRFRENLESIENHPEYDGLIGYDTPLTNQSSTQDIVEHIQIIEALSSYGNDTYELHDWWVQWNLKRRKKRNICRNAIKQQNSNFIRRAKQLHIWLPYNKDIRKWYKLISIPEKCQRLVFFIEFSSFELKIHSQ